MEKRLELRMYFFVPYNISPIQQAIQAGHAALEYALKYQDVSIFREFAKEWKTWIILNGGTTNSSLDTEGNPLGDLNQIHEVLWANDVDHSLFYEPDLNNALTAVCFICDERVWNYKDYPDFVEFCINDHLITDAVDRIQIRTFPMEFFKDEYPVIYEKWVNTLGGKKNVFLRELIKGKKLA